MNNTPTKKITISSRTILFIGCINLSVLAALFTLSPEPLKHIYYSAHQFLTTEHYQEILTYLSILLMCMCVELFVLGLKKSSLYKLYQGSESARTDLIVAGLRIIGLLPALSIFFTFGLYINIPNFFNEHFSINLIQETHPVIQFAVWFILKDFLEYWFHRTAHRISFLWEAHKFHHAATEFTILTGNRIHAIEHAARHIFTALPLAILGAPVEYYFAMVAIKQVVDLYQHSMVNWDYGWIGKWIIYSPIGHRIHHSKSPEHWNKNFGDIFTIWDQLFGTYYKGENVNREVGVTNNCYNHNNTLKDYFLCYLLIFRSILNSLKTGKWLEPNSTSPQASPQATPSDNP